MEKEKLLFTLKNTLRILLVILINQGSLVLADNVVSDRDALVNSFEDLRQKSLDSAMEHFEKILVDAKKDGYFKGKTNSLKPHKQNATKLMVFVSTSMPKEVLKNYYREAEIYGATLVFNGLPNGSFRALGDLVTELHESVVNARFPKRKGAASVIDDESFKKFNVSRVPTFILAREENCLIQKTCKQSFDRIEGNVGLKYALEKFSDNGTLRHHAKEYLQ